jgi:hypothetical protein
MEVSYEEDCMGDVYFQTFANISLQSAFQHFEAPDYLKNIKKNQFNIKENTLHLSYKHQSTNPAHGNGNN